MRDQRPMNRREMLMMSAGALLSLREKRDCDMPMRDGAPAVDYHVHIDGDITVDAAIRLARQRGVKFGLLRHAGVKGRGYQISDDAGIRDWVRSLRHKPVFIGIEAEGADWTTAFSKEAIGLLDYVQGDALGLPDPSGKPMEMWRPNFQVGDPQSFMDRYVDYHVERVTGGPLDILVMATYLPDTLRGDADRLWTPKRMDAIIDALVQHHTALEIDGLSRVPRYPFLERAKAAGVTFAFGSNGQTLEALGDISYGIESYKRLGLAPSQFFCPKVRKEL